MNMSNVLGVFSRAYVINRDQDTDRRALVHKRLADVGIEFERFPAICYTERGKHRWAGMRGANASHLAIVMEAQKQKLSNVLIIEDDVMFRERFHESWSKILPKLKSLKYDIFFGYNWLNRGGQLQDIDLVFIKNTPCVHFWAIQSEFYKTFIETALSNESSPQPQCIDRIFTSTNAVILAPTYNLVGQDQGISLVMENHAREARWSA
jgi:hypothetical protein